MHLCVFFFFFFFFRPYYTQCILENNKYWILNVSICFFPRKLHRRPFWHYTMCSKWHRQHTTSASTNSSFLWYLAETDIGGHQWRTWHRITVAGDVWATDTSCTSSMMHQWGEETLRCHHKSRGVIHPCGIAMWRTREEVPTTITFSNSQTDCACFWCYFLSLFIAFCMVCVSSDLFLYFEEWHMIYQLYKYVIVLWDF